MHVIVVICIQTVHVTANDNHPERGNVGEVFIRLSRYRKVVVKVEAHCFPVFNVTTRPTELRPEAVRIISIRIAIFAQASSVGCSVRSSNHVESDSRELLNVSAEIREWQISRYLYFHTHSSRYMFLIR